MYGRVVQLWVLPAQKAEHLGTGPYHRPVAMGCHGVSGTMCIEGCIEGHASAHADSLYLTLGIDSTLDGMPPQLNNRTERLGIDPALVDGMGHAVSEDGRARRLIVSVGTVEELVPETVNSLARGEAGSLRYKTPFFPYVTLFGIWAQVFCLVVMAFTPDLREALYAGVPMLLAPMLWYRLRAWKRSRQAVVAREAR